MLRLSSSQILLTNKDVGRTLNPKRTRRPPTYLYTKGKQPLRGASSATPSIPHISTSRPSPSSRFAGRRHSSRSRPVTFPSNSPDWSASSDSESTTTNMPSTFAVSTDGVSDVYPFIDGIGPRPFRQVVSLETIDSFPDVPFRLGPPIPIYEDDPEAHQEEAELAAQDDLSLYSEDEEESDGSDTSASESSLMSLGDFDDFDEAVNFSHYEELESETSEDEMEEDVEGEYEEADEGEDEEEDEESPIILVESFWDPNTMLITDPRPTTPMVDIAETNPIGPGLFETPPRRFA